MPKRIQGFPQVSSHIQTVVLGGTKYRVRFTYRDRTASWYMDLRTVDEEPIALGRRLSPGWGPTAGFEITDQPEGILLTQGADGYEKADLGDSLNVVFIPDDEIPATEDELPLLVEILP
jgi:hypothetical protein